MENKTKCEEDVTTRNNEGTVMTNGDDKSIIESGFTSSLLNCDHDYTISLDLRSCQL